MDRLLLAFLLIGGIFGTPFAILIIAIRRALKRLGAIQDSLRQLSDCETPSPTPYVPQSDLSIIPHAGDK